MACMSMYVDLESPAVRTYYIIYWHFFFFLMKQFLEGKLKKTMDPYNILKSDSVF